MTAKKSKAMAEGRRNAWMMTRLLDTMGPTTTVGLGALKGLPAKTSDPDKVEAAAQLWLDRAETATSLLRELEYRSKARRLRTAAAGLRNGGGVDQEAIDWFVAEGAAYCEKKGFIFEDLREFGVSAALLKEAGISRGGA